MQFTDREHAQGFAKEALAWLNQRNLVPTPVNFEIVYAYLDGSRPELKHVVDALSAEGKLDTNAMSGLYQRFFRLAKHDDQVAQLGEKIGAELDSVLHLLESAGRDHSAYGHTLSLASGELGAAKLGDAGFKVLIDKVVTATRAMEARSKTLEKQLHNSSREVTELRERLESVRREALTDQLTGIPNRKAFDTELKNAIQQAIEHGEPLSLVMCDIDHFKSFNDTWGHQTGDQVLKLVASCLRENVKGRDTAARYGGEEFAVILPQTGLSDALKLADQIRAKVESKKLVKRSTGDILGTITMSAGVAQYDPAETGEDMIRRADSCLYIAKRTGRNRVVCETDPAFADQLAAEATVAA